MLKALLFDLDGTLAKTGSAHQAAWVEILRPHGYDVTWDFYRDRLSGRLTPEIVSDLLPDLSPEESREMAEAKEAGFRAQAGTLEPLPGLLDFIAQARKKGMEISLVTNAPKENVHAVLQALDLIGVFEPVILADEVGVGKPDPAPYQAALEALCVCGERTLAFEDSPSGIASSVAAGIPTVGVASAHDPETLRDCGVDLVVYDFTDPRLEALIEECGRS